MTTTPTVASAARARRTTRRTARSAALSLALAVGVMAAGEPTVSVAGPAPLLLAETCSLGSAVPAQHGPASVLHA